MKKQYISPASEYINFNAEDVVTDTLSIDDYTDRSGSGDAPDINVGGKSNIVSPDEVPDF